MDHSKEVDELLPQNIELATKVDCSATHDSRSDTVALSSVQHGKLAEAVEALLGLEKKSRLVPHILSRRDTVSHFPVAAQRLEICRTCVRRNCSDVPSMQGHSGTERKRRRVG